MTPPNHDAKIAQLELLTVYMGLAYNASSTRGMHGIWFVDNIAALMSLIRGRSNNDELDSMAGAIHGLLFALRRACYFEWVQSKDNWSDGVSRQGEHDPLHAPPAALPPHRQGLPVRLSALDTLVPWMECSHRESVRCQMTHATWVAFQTKALQYRQYRPESIRRKR